MGHQPRAVFFVGAWVSMLEGIETNFVHIHCLKIQRSKKIWGGVLLGNGRCPALLLTLQQAAIWPLPSAVVTPWRAHFLPRSVRRETPATEEHTILWCGFRHPVSL